MITVYLSGKMTKEDLSITYENNIFYCTKNNTKWISVDGKKWYGEEKRIAELEKENAELRKVAEFQQSSNMSRHFENKKLKEGLAVGSTFNKALNSMNKSLEEERDKYRNMVFDKDNQLTKAKELLERLLITSCNSDVLNLLPNCSEVLRVRVEAEQFLNSEVKK